jgi:hypothetical protein
MSATAAALASVVARRPLLTQSDIRVLRSIVLLAEAQSVGASGGEIQLLEVLRAYDVVRPRRVSVCVCVR